MIIFMEFFPPFFSEVECPSRLDSRTIVNYAVFHLIVSKQVRFTQKQPSLKPVNLSRDTNSAEVCVYVHIRNLQ